MKRDFNQVSDHSSKFENINETMQTETEKHEILSALNIYFTCANIFGIYTDKIKEDRLTIVKYCLKLYSVIIGLFYISANVKYALALYWAADLNYDCMILICFVCVTSEFFIIFCICHTHLSFSKEIIQHITDLKEIHKKNLYGPKFDFSVTILALLIIATFISCAGFSMFLLSLAGNGLNNYPEAIAPISPENSYVFYAKLHSAIFAGLAASTLLLSLGLMTIICYVIYVESDVLNANVNQFYQMTKAMKEIDYVDKYITIVERPAPIVLDNDTNDDHESDFKTKLPENEMDNTTIAKLNNHHNLICELVRVANKMFSFYIALGLLSGMVTICISMYKLVYNGQQVTMIIIYGSQMFLHAFHFFTISLIGIIINNKVSDLLQ